MFTVISDWGRLVASVLGLFATGVTASLGAVEDQITAIEEEAIREYREKVSGKLDKAIFALDVKYTAALERLLKEASLAGKLEEAVALRDEVARISAGQGVPVSDTEDTPDSLKPLRKTYREQMAQLERQRATLSKPILNKYDEILADLQRKLTVDQKLDDALAVKAARKDFADKVSGMGLRPPEAPAAPRPPAEAATPPAAPELAFPPKLRSSPAPRPSTKCRMVFVRLPDGPKRQEKEAHAIKLAAEAREEDWVAFGADLDVGAIVALRADGSFSRFSAHDMKRSDFRGPAVAVLDCGYVPLTSLSAEGKIAFHGRYSQEKFPDASRFEALEGVVQIGGKGRCLFALDSTGKLHAGGEAAQGPSVQAALAFPGQVCEFSTFSHKLLLLDTDGKVASIDPAGTVRETADAALSLLPCCSFIAKDGAFRSYGISGVNDTLATLEPSRLVWPKSFDARLYDVFSLLDRDRNPATWIRIGTKPGGGAIWEPQEDIETALRGAVEVQALYLAGNRWLAALLPSETVPRGGIWEVDELIEARR